MTREQRSILFQRLLTLEVTTYQQPHGGGAAPTIHLTGKSAAAICDEVARVLAGVYRYDLDLWMWHDHPRSFPGGAIVLRRSPEVDR